jgi:hypothetical protein
LKGIWSRRIDRVTHEYSSFDAANVLSAGRPVLRGRRECLEQRECQRSEGDARRFPPRSAHLSAVHSDRCGCTGPAEHSGYRY